MDATRDVLGAIDASTPADLNLHLAVDNYATYKHPAVTASLAQHPRFHLPFTPNSPSWLNLGERFSAEITDLEVAISLSLPRRLSPVGNRLMDGLPLRAAWGRVRL